MTHTIAPLVREVAVRCVRAADLLEATLARCPHVAVAGDRAEIQRRLGRSELAWAAWEAVTEVRVGGSAAAAAERFVSQFEAIARTLRAVAEENDFLLELRAVARRAEPRAPDPLVWWRLDDVIERMW